MTPAKKAPAAKTPAKGTSEPATRSTTRRATPKGPAADKTPSPAAKTTVSSTARGSSGPTDQNGAEPVEALAASSRAAARRPPAGTKAGDGTDAAVSGRVATKNTPTAEREGTEPKGKSVPSQDAPYATDDKFLAEQRELLEHERIVYQGQAADLKAEADSLAQEREPGDVQFDEESGEGGTVTVDRERDLALSAQALAAVEEIDAAMLRIGTRTYGACERCHQPIPKARLRALPYARLCVACKSGGLTRR